MTDGGITVTTVGPPVDDTGAIGFDNAGNLYVTGWDSDTLTRVSPAGLRAFLGASEDDLSDPAYAPDGWPDAGLIPFGPLLGQGSLQGGWLAVAADGTLYLTESDVNQVLRIDPQGAVSYLGSGTDGGADGPVAAADFSHPSYLALDAAGGLFVEDYNGLRRIDPSGVVSTLARSFGGAGGMALDSAGNLYYPCSDNTIQVFTAAGRTLVFAGDGDAGYLDGASTSAEFDHPTCVAVDTAGNVYVSDSGNYRVRKIDLSGQVTTVAGDGQPCDTAGAGGPDGSAQLAPSAMAFSPDGDLYVAAPNALGSGGPLMKIHFGR
ncbi:MAG TPA: hypothetical protein VMB50_06025 [Myxococcales bacterium]|nr:hypothetical protein [Myxococcales bacterium]